MLERTDFEKKQIIFLFANKGDKLLFRNDNVVIRDQKEKIKYQITCYRIFILFIIGDTSITTGLIRHAKKFGFVICLMNQSFRLYSIIGNRMEGNTLLHRKQYAYDNDELAKFFVINKIYNQRQALNSIRRKSIANKEAIQKLDGYLDTLAEKSIEKESLLGLEGSAARVYFPQMFDNVSWNGRKPRIKCDYVNTTLDIGYNLLFQLIDSLLQVYGFDVYCGVYHKEFYQRKSLVCDVMEPLRPIIDLEVRKAINLKQCKVEDYQVYQGKYCLQYKKSAVYVEFLLEALLKYRNEIFIFIQKYYRSFMKGRKMNRENMFEIIS